MKVHIVSDLHMEFTPSWKYVPPNADLTLIPGDISNGIDSAESLRRFGYTNPYFYVAGNHEFYGLNYSKTVKALRDASKPLAKYFELDSTLFHDPSSGEEYLILGATLWTDFELYGDPGRHSEHAGRTMNDYRRIETGHSGSFLRPQDTATLHDITVGWLDEMMRSYPLMKKVVMTHHAPSKQSVVVPFIGDPLSPAFASDLEWLMRKHNPVLWVHGHVHSSHDYMIGKTRVVANPRGYPTDRLGLGLTTENTKFNPNLVVEI